MIQVRVVIENAVPALCALAAIAAKHGIEAWQAYKAASPRQQRIHGRSQAAAFQQKMTRREAALILGVSESAVEKKIREATKINEAKDIMMGKS